MARAQRGDGPVIDIHCHRECAPVAAMMRAAARAAGKVALGHGDALTRAVNQRQLEAIRPKMESFDVRLADMDRQGVDVQAVSVAVYQYYYWADAELGAKAARMINEEFVQATARYDGRFVPLGTVPLQDCEAAVEELSYLAGPLGMRGIEIGTHVSGPEIPDPEISCPRLERFWAEVERLGLVVVVHTEGTTHPERLQGHNFVNIIGHAFEATLAIAHLIFDGVVARHPDLKIVVVHGGGYLPAYPGRIDHGWRARDDVREGVTEPPTSYLRKFFFDTMVFEPGQLRYLVDTYGAEHVLLGTDYPYDMGDDDPLALLAAADLTQEQVNLIAGGNAARLLGVSR
jgi:aminocarboxymuconate-semialdehyde decarboxylase